MHITETIEFRRRAASALMHPVTLAALAVLFVNDLLFKALWPGAWIPGKLSDLAWMMFAPPALAYIISFATVGNLRAQQIAFAAAYAGLPLLYVAFNTFEPVHDAILRGLGLLGGDGPRSPLDATDSLVIPFAMIVALWVWFRPPLNARGVRTRLALLAAIAAAMASVATSYASDRGITDVGRTGSGAVGTYVNTDTRAYVGSHESMDGGLTWTKTSEGYVPLESQEWRELEVMTPSGDVFFVDREHTQIVRERVEREVSQDEMRNLRLVRRWSDDRLTVYGTSASREVIYSYGYLLTGGNSWMQALDKRDVQDRVVSGTVSNLFYDDQSGNLIAAMGLQGVVVVAPDGTSTRVAVGRYSPTDFSFRSKVDTFFGSLLYSEPPAVTTGAALLLAFSSAALALVAPAASSVGPRVCFALAAAISALLALSVGVYPHASVAPWDDDGEVLGSVFFVLTGFGLIPLSLVFTGMVVVPTRLKQFPAVIAASIGMLLVILLGGLVLFETGERTATFVAVGLVGLATLGLWAYQKRKQT